MVPSSRPFVTGGQSEWTAASPSLASWTAALDLAPRLATGELARTLRRVRG